jgi:DNA mismatch endonuclease, patch repair protein
MVDVVDAATRSRMMAGIRGTNTKPELVVRRYLHARGLRFRLHRSDLPGRPDLVLRKYGAVVLVHGCFWHAHQGCSYFRLPESRRDFWEEKLLGNRRRDDRQVAALGALHWRVAVIWECALRDGGTEALEDLYVWLLGEDPGIELPTPRSEPPPPAR